MRESSLIRLSYFLRLKPARKAERQAASSSAPTQAPLPEDDSQLDPPPYSGSSTTQGDQNVAPQATATTQETSPQGLLDPTLNFTAAQMEQQWQVKDIIFARAVVQFIAERFDGNLRSWAGYKYTYINDVQSLKHPPRGIR